eukprot:EG_transcript_3699
MGCGQSRSTVVAMVNVMTMEEEDEGRLSAPVPGRSFDLPDPLHLSFTSGTQKQQLYSWDHYQNIVEYHVDRHGIIQNVPTAKSWATAAAEAMADLPPSAVLGRSLYQFLTPVMATFYAEVLGMLNVTVVRSSVSFRWFCDSPTHRREAALLFVRLEDAVAVLSVTVDEAPHRAGFLARVAYVGEAERKSCAFCNCFLHEGEWLTPEDYYRTMSAVDAAGPVAVCQVSCPQCSERVVWRLAPNFYRSRHCLKGMAPLLCGYSSLNTTEFTPSPHSAVGRSDSVWGRPAPVSLRVLLVNGDMVTARVIEALLRGLGHKPVLLSTAEAVPAFLQDNTVALILVDMVLAGTSSCDLIQALRRDHPRTPLVALSGCMESRMAARKAGAKEFLLKPVTGAALQKVLKPFCAPKLSSPSTGTLFF